MNNFENCFEHCFGVTLADFEQIINNDWMDLIIFPGESNKFGIIFA